MTDGKMRTLGEEGQMIFDDDPGDIDLKDLDIGESDRLQQRHSRDRDIGDRGDDGRDPFDGSQQQSYFSSRIGDSSSDITVDSDMLAAYQHALK